MTENSDADPLRRSMAKRVAVWTIALVAAWAVAAYLFMPYDWRRYFRKHPSLDDMPDITKTGSGIPADPLNVALIGTKAQLVKAMLGAGWYPADPLSLKSCLEISEATLFKRPYDDAPVSSLYLFGRKEDIAFEKPVGDNPRERNHVRFWKTEKVDTDGRPVWVGSATFDKSVGLSHTTGQVTHHTAADIDAERDTLFHDLDGPPDRLQEQYIEYGFHKELQGKNGEGDPWHTDGNLWVGVLATT